MKRTLIFIFLIIYFYTFCIAQFNPNDAKDSNKHNLPGKIPMPPDPFSAMKDTTNIFDSLHGNLTVYIKNINNIIGNINVAIFNSYSSFVNNGPVFKGAIAPVNASNMMIHFDSIPKGIYSVAVFHDEDKNGSLKTNKMNIPEEGYGFSNNVANGFGPPNFIQTKFFYSVKNKTITIKMIYFKFPK